MEKLIPARSAGYRKPSGYRKQIPIAPKPACVFDLKPTPSKGTNEIDDQFQHEITEPTPTNTKDVTIPNNNTISVKNSIGIARGGVAVPFPYKLYIMLEQIGSEAHSYGKSIVGWQPHGRAFKVHKKKEFVESVMPYYFNQTQYASFQRQLNLYGFLRLTTKGPDHGAVYHPCFVRDQRLLLKCIVRQKIKGTKIRSAGLNPEDQPDFYAGDSNEQHLRAIVAHCRKQQQLRSTSTKNSQTEFLQHQYQLQTLLSLQKKK